MVGVVYTFRVTLYTLLLLLVSLISIPLAIVATLLGKRLNVNYYVARTFWHLAGPIMGWKFEVEGEEHLWHVTDGDQTGSADKGGRSAVMIGNHQSFVDIMYLARIFPKHAAIMAKSSIRFLPGLGQWMMMSGTVFINRGNNKSAVASMTQAGEDMKRKRISLWIFPEGTRTLFPSPDLLPFKKGAFYLAVQSGTPIVPVLCQSYYHLFDGKTRFRGGTLKIKVLPPISTKGLTAADVPALMEKTRDTMLETLQQLSSPTPSTSIRSDASPTPLLTPHVGDATETRGYGSTDGGRPSVSSENGGRGGRRSASSRRSLERKAKEGGKSLAIAMVSDFFHPVVGGVEGHVYALGVQLMRRGHKVIVITHSHPGRHGVRYLAPGLKVYHLPYLPIASSATLPNFLLFLPYLRNILIREQIDLVHGHGSLSSLAHEAMFHAPLLGVRTVFTDHSLFGFSDAVGVLTNKLLAGALRNVDAVICVSNTGRENTVLRAELDPSLVSVIPNALEVDKFRPAPQNADPDCITIVVISRLVYRKGIDLLVASAPTICALFPQVRFLVGGDGPKLVDLLQMRESHVLQDRITLLGSVRPSDVREVLTRGQIYLNTSLTEAFGISIIEAASAGLFVVSTKVGGVPEILPDDMVEFAGANEDDVIRALTKAIETIKSGRHDPHLAHARVKDMYAWSQVAERTEAVYRRAMRTPHKDTGERLARLLSLGPLFGPIMCIIIAVEHIFFWVLEVWQPRDEIDLAVDWSKDAFQQAVNEDLKRTR